MTSQTPVGEDAEPEGSGPPGSDILKRLAALDTCSVSDALDSLGLSGAVTVSAVAGGPGGRGSRSPGASWSSTERRTERSHCHLPRGAGGGRGRRSHRQRRPGRRVMLGRHTRVRCQRSSRRRRRHRRCVQGHRRKRAARTPRIRSGGSAGVSERPDHSGGHGRPGEAQVSRSILATI